MPPKRQASSGVGTAWAIVIIIAFLFALCDFGLGLAGLIIANKAHGEEGLRTVNYATPGNYTFTAPHSIKWLTIRAWGAGGGGSGGSATIAGSGGGSGAFVQDTFHINGGQQVTIVVGQGGVGGIFNSTELQAATAGGASYVQLVGWGYLLTAGGGGPGNLTNQTISAAASASDTFPANSPTTAYTVSGQQGAISTGPTASGGRGGSSPFGGVGGWGASSVYVAPAQAGGLPGGGGGGGDGAAYNVGGAGANGLVQVLY